MTYQRKHPPIRSISTWTWKIKTVKKKVKNIKFSKTKLTAIADFIFQWYIRERDKDKQCVTLWWKFCQWWWALKQAWHFVSRWEYSTRWNPLNCHWQCGWCNWKYLGNWEQYLHGKNIDKMYWDWTADKLTSCRWICKVSDEDKIMVIRENTEYLIKMYDKTFDMINEKWRKILKMKSFDISNYLE